MPFRGNDPYGTDGGMDSMIVPQSPADVRIAEGGNHIAFLVVNGPITLRQRSMIEDVVRTIGSRGESIVALLTRDDGAVVEGDTRDINFAEGIALVYVAPNVVEIKIGTGGVTTAMLADALVTATKLATNSVTTIKIADNAVTEPKIGADAVTNIHIKDGTIVPANLAPNSVTADAIATDAVGSLEIAPNAVTAVHIAADAVGASEIINGSVGTLEIADGAVTAAKLAAAYALLGHTHSNAFNQFVAAIPAGAYGAGTSFPHAWTFTLDANFVYRVYSIVLMRCDGGVGTTATGTFRIETETSPGVWATTGSSLPFEADQGVDSTLFALSYIGNPGTRNWRLTWVSTGGTLNVKTGYLLQIAMPTVI